MSETFEKPEDEFPCSEEEASRASECFATSVEGYRRVEDMTAAECLESAARGFSRWLGERGEDAAELVSSARKAMENLRPERDGVAERVVDALRNCEQFLKEGSESLSGEKVQALVSILALAVLLCVNPEQARGLVQEDPEPLMRAIAALCGS